jgi:hypothetical protein
VRLAVQLRIDASLFCGSLFPPTSARLAGAPLVSCRDSLAYCREEAPLFSLFDKPAKRATYNEHERRNHYRDERNQRAPLVARHRNVVIKPPAAVHALP